jgi:hypothetical protein
MPIIPTAPPVAPGDYPSVNPQAASAGWDSVAKGAAAAGQVAQFGLEIAKRVEQAQDHTLALKAENEIQSDIESVAESFAQRSDYDNFQKDSETAAIELRKKYEAQYGKNPRVWRAMAPHLEGQIGRMTRAVERRRFGLVVDQNKSDLDKNADISIRQIIASTDPAEKQSIRNEYAQKVQASVVNGLISRQEANDYENKFNYKVDASEVSAGLESENPTLVKQTLERIRNHEFKYLESENPAALNSMAGNAQKWLDTHDDLTKGMEASDAAWKAIMPNYPNLNDPIPVADLHDELRKNKALMSNPQAYAAAESDLSRRIQERNAQQSEFAKAHTDAVYKMYNAKKTPDEIYASREFMQLPDKEQAAFKSQIAEIQRSAEMRRRADEEYYLGKDARALSAFKAKMEIIFLQNAPSYWNDSDPANLVKMTESQITAKAAMYGPERTQKLLEDRRTLLKKGPEATYLVTVDERLKRSAKESKIIPQVEKPNEDQQKRYMIFEDEVQKRLTAFEATELKGSRKATPPEIEKIIDEVKMDRVYTPSTFGSDDSSLKILTPSDEESYVVVNNTKERMNQISKDRMDEIVGALRQAGERVSSEAIMETWIGMGRPKK